MKLAKTHGSPKYSRKMPSAVADMNLSVAEQKSELMGKPASSINENF
jgi:hypothetical protein